jgi:hypothetical protein
MLKGANIETADWTRPNIITQLNHLHSAEAKFIRFPVILDAYAMAKWDIDYYWKWFKDVCQVFEDISPTLIQNQQPAIFDIHHPVGGFKRGRWQVFFDDALMRAHIDMCHYATDRFKDNAAFFAFAPFNEPAPRNRAQLTDFYKTLVPALRAAGYHKHVVVSHIGADCDNMRYVEIVNDDHILYEFHDYKPRNVLKHGGRPFETSITKIEDWLKHVIRFADAHPDKEILCGEFGCFKDAGSSFASDVQIEWLFEHIDFFNSRGWSWCWNEESLNESSVFGVPENVFQNMWRR